MQSSFSDASFILRRMTDLLTDQLDFTPFIEVCCTSHFGLYYVLCAHPPGPRPTYCKTPFSLGGRTFQRLCPSQLSQLLWLIHTVQTSTHRTTRKTRGSVSSGWRLGPQLGIARPSAPIASRRMGCPQFPAPAPMNVNLYPTIGDNRPWPPLNI